MIGKTDSVFPDRPCTTCGKGVLRPRVDKEPAEHNGQTGDVDMHYSVCDVCGIDLANGDQVNLNTKKMVIFCKKVDGHLSGTEIKAIRKKLGLSKKEASKVFKGGLIPFSEYEDDLSEHSPETDKLLRQAAKHPEAFMKARDRLDTPMPPPGSHVLPDRPASPAPMPG